MMGPLPTKRSDAKAIGIVRYRTGTPCLRGHVDERFTSTGQCMACLSNHNAAWRSANPEKAAAAQKFWRESQPKREAASRTRKPRSEIQRKYQLKKMGFPNGNPTIKCIPLDPKVQWSLYYDAKKSEIAETQRRYRKINRIKLKAAWEDWYQKNRVSQVEKATMRRKKVIDATPGWLTTDHRRAISDTYFLSIQKSVETGIEHHVDHIVPIAGKLVCGLHVPWNLQVIPALENIRKSNTHVS